MNNYRKTRFCMIWSLVFYFFFVCCTEKKDDHVSIQWEGDKAVAIIVPQQLLTSIPKDSIKEVLQIRLANSEQSVIGEYSFQNEEILFKPIIPFTRGLIYKVYVKKELIDEIEIPALTTALAPQVLAVYPLLDTVPENLLKFYILFSKPMQTGDELTRIHLIKEDHDTLSSVFLDMEIWNSERNMLTLWLDPGRIKRDLQPNKLLGLPLDKGFHYQLVIDRNWQDGQGLQLKENFIKIFFAGDADILSPDEQSWTINTPTAGTKEQLVVNFNESLDHVLAEKTLVVIDESNNEIKGKLIVNDQGRIARFLPDNEWKKGIYILQIESRLEDLAGNNLDRLFDTDITQKQRPSKNSHQKRFEVR